MRKVKASHNSAQVKHLYGSYFLMLKSPLCQKYRGMFLTLMKHQYKKKRRHLTQFYDKTPYMPQKKIKKQRNTKTWITQRLRTNLGQSLGGTDNHPTGVVKPVNGTPPRTSTNKWNSYRYYIDQDEVALRLLYQLT